MANKNVKPNLNDPKKPTPPAQESKPDAKSVSFVCS